MNYERNKAQDLIKIIAIISMVIDHLRYLFPDYQNILVVFGRWAFPFFAFLIATNTYRAILTNNSKTIKRYLVNLALFSLISEVPYRLLVGSTGKAVDTLNIMPTLLLGFLLTLLITYKVEAYKRIICIIPILVGLYHWDNFLEYGFFGVLLIPMLYITISQKTYFSFNIFFGISTFIATMSSLQYFVPIIKVYGIYNSYVMPICASIIIGMLVLMYINKIKINLKIYKIGKIFWWFYPIHMLLIYFLIKLI